MSVLLKIAIYVLSFACYVMTADAQVAIIAHKDVPAESIGRSGLLDFYLFDVLSWPSSELDVVICDLRLKGDVKDEFYEYLGKSSSRVKSIWLKRKLAGEGDPPEFFETEEELLQYVADTPGAIGFVHLSKVSDRVKVLFRISNEAG